MNLVDIIDINLLDRFLTNLKNLFLNKDGTATKAASIPFGTVDSTSTATAFTATVDGITELRDGVSCYLKNTVITSAAASTAPKRWTLNINNLGAKPVYVTTAAATYSTTQFTVNYKFLFTYDSSLNSGNGGWYIGQLFNSNTTYSDMTQAEINAGTGTTGRKITPKILRDNFYTEDEVNNLLGNKANSNDLATVATSGSYEDLSDKPTIPTIPTIPSASTDIPQMDGTGTAGSASNYAKGDHVHPSDTSREARVTTVSHGTSDTTFALTPNVLHTWGTINSLTLTLASGSSTYVDGYWFKFTAGSSFTALTLPTGVNWVTEPEIEAGKTYEVMIVNGLASYVTDDIGDSVKAKTRIVNHGTSDTTYQLVPNEFHIWGEVASLNLTLKAEANGYVSGYWFRFTCGSTPTVLTLPSSVEWYYEEVEFEANHTYEVTIVEGKACYTDYASTTQVATKQWVRDNFTVPTINIVAASGTTLHSAINTIYTYSDAVTSLAITLPAITDVTKAEAISFVLTTGTSPNITFSSANSTTILYHDRFEFEDDTMYEVNAMFVGSSWIIGMCKVTTT